VWYPTLQPRVETRFTTRFKPVICKHLVLLSFCAWLAGCAQHGYVDTTPAQQDTTPAQQDTVPEHQACSGAWNQFVDRVDEAGAFDAQDWPIPEYSYLRMDRTSAFFLSRGDSLRGGLYPQAEMNWTQRKTWLAQAYTRGKQARQIENSKLSTPVDLNYLESCLEEKQASLLYSDEFWRYLNSVEYPDRYSTSRQFFGLYYLFRPVVSWQVDALNERVTGIFQNYESNYDWRYYYWKDEHGQYERRQHEHWHDGPDQDQLLNNEQGKRAQVTDGLSLQAKQAARDWQTIQQILDSDRQRDALGKPLFNQQQAQDLLRFYRPVIGMEMGHGDDRIGRPQSSAEQWSVDDQPAVYTLLTTVHWNGEWVPQLVYHWWYPSRPAVGWLDILAGELGGLIWRVTLDWQGNVLFYDSIHPCGCYHKVYPAQRNIHFTGTSSDEEALLVLPVLHPGPGYQPLIYISSIAHYVVGLSFEQANDLTEANDLAEPPLAKPETKPETKPKKPASPSSAYGYELSDYDELRRQPSGDRYLFGADGLVAGTERLERFLLWNMGVYSPGGMRQWGHHATAFASRRHFDDPLFFERYFTLSDVPDTAVGKITRGK